MTDTTQWTHDAAAWKARAERAERQAEALAKALWEISEMQVRETVAEAWSDAQRIVRAALAAYREGR